ncbi:MAG: AAA family ATPase [Pseudomonadota bacterium]
MDHTTERFVVITGCSGGGKSTLLTALHERGYRTVDEPGRRLMRHSLADPYKDLKGFAEQAVAMSTRDIEKERNSSGWVFFDRGLIDAAAALTFATGASINDTLKNAPRFYRRVFFAPPWRAIYRQDEERQHDFGAAKQEAIRLASAYNDLGYQLTDLPLWSVEDRAQWVIDQLGSAPAIG